MNFQIGYILIPVAFIGFTWLVRFMLTSSLGKEKKGDKGQ